MDKKEQTKIKPEIKKEDLDTRQVPANEKNMEPEAPDMGEEQAP